MFGFDKIPSKDQHVSEAFLIDFSCIEHKFKKSWPFIFKRIYVIRTFAIESRTYIYVIWTQRVKMFFGWKDFLPVFTYRFKKIVEEFCHF